MNVYTGHHRGKCPKCDSENITYQDMGPDGDGPSSYWKNAICNSCRIIFVEWYDFNYTESVGHEDEGGNDDVK